jgi:hypothetical protein
MIRGGKTSVIEVEILNDDIRVQVHFATGLESRSIKAGKTEGMTA